MQITFNDIIQSIEANEFQHAFQLLEAYQPLPTEAQIFHYLRALVSHQLRRYEDSLQSFQASVTQKSPTEWWLNFGILCRDAEQWSLLADVVQELIARKAAGYEATALIAEAARRDCRLDEAVDIFAHELKRQPNNPRVTHGYANALRDAGQYQHSLKIFEQLVLDSSDPEVQWNKALTELALGPLNLASLETRFCRATPPFLEYTPSLLPRMTNQNEAKGSRVLVVSEQGFGDTLQFCRYIKALKQESAALAWVVPKRLKTLLSLSFPTVDLLDADKVDESQWDVWISLMSCGSLKLQEEEPPYLAAPLLQQRYEQYKDAIFLNWSGSPSYVHDYWRSLTIEAFQPLYTSSLPNQLISIQHGLNEEQRRDLPRRVEPLGHRLDIGKAGFCETASLLKAGKALVTTDTSVAHLAGGLGVRTHLILGPIADWRWEWHRESTVWYPSMRIHRWRNRYEIPEVMKKISEELSD